MSKHPKTQLVYCYYCFCLAAAAAAECAFEGKTAPRGGYLFVSSDDDPGPSLRRKGVQALIGGDTKYFGPARKNTGGGALIPHTVCVCA